MTLQQMRYLIAISNTGSLSKASETLYVSQPSLSGAVKEMEKELGMTILNRSGKGVTLTPDGAELVAQVRQVLLQYDNMMERYTAPNSRKKKFGVSAQHYSFAVKAFVEMVHHYGTSQYEFAMRETKTREVIQDVATLRSEIGILYMSDFNRSVLAKLLRANDLSFHPLCQCRAYVYLWRGHPLAACKAITFDQLADYPCLSFEQGDNSSFYFTEEILTTKEYPRTIHTNDRATNLNLLIALNAYTLCSGIVCEELNGSDYVAVPFKDDDENHNSVMEIGYLSKKNMTLSDIGQRYVAEIQAYLKNHAERVE
jgi:DNA-binding transcriptional LysR family regulator